jgi:hypothetical protein
MVQGGEKLNFLETNLPNVVFLADSRVVASSSSLDEMPESLLEKFLSNKNSFISIDIELKRLCRSKDDSHLKKVRTPKL